MAGSLTNFAEAKVLDALFGGQALGAPATWYLALFTASPTETGGLGAEAANYTRLAVTSNLTNFPNAVQGAPSSKSNGVDFVFAPASGATGTVTHVGLMDSATLGAGVCWAYFDVTTPKAYAAGDIPVLSSGSLSLTAD